MAIHFSGTGSQRLDTISTFAPPSSGTVMFWKNSETGALRIIGTNSIWEARISGANMLHEFQQSGVPSVANTDGVWQHWAFTYNGTNKGVYINGVEVYHAASAHGTGGTQTLSIGTSNWNLSQSYKGLLEDVRIYNRNLSSEEIELIYNAEGTDGIYNGCLHRWPLTEGAEDAAVVSAKDVIGGLDANPQGTGTTVYKPGIIRTIKKQIIHA